jgi:hypothetical protein
MDITRLPSVSLSTCEVDTGLSDRDRDEYFPLMRLPTELRLIVYENWTGETRRALALIFGEIFFQDLDLDLLQVSKDVRREAKSILQRHHENLTPCLTFNHTGKPKPFKKKASTVFSIRYIVLLLVEGLALRAAPNAAARAAVTYRDGGKLRQWEFRTRMIDYGDNMALNDRRFREFYERTVQQLQNEAVLTLRVLLDFDSAYTPSELFPGSLFWGTLHKVTYVEFPGTLRFRFVFVVQPQHLERCRALTAKPFTLPSWVTNDMWTIEVTQGGLDPAVD